MNGIGGDGFLRAIRRIGGFVEAIARLSDRDADAVASDAGLRAALDEVRRLHPPGGEPRLATRAGGDAWSALLLDANARLRTGLAEGRLGPSTFDAAFARPSHGSFGKGFERLRAIQILRTVARVLGRDPEDSGFAGTTPARWRMIETPEDVDPVAALALLGECAATAGMTATALDAPDAIAAMRAANMARRSELEGPALRGCGLPPDGYAVRRDADAIALAHHCATFAGRLDVLVGRIAVEGGEAIVGRGPKRLDRPIQQPLVADATGSLVDALEAGWMMQAVHGGPDDKWRTGLTRLRGAVGLDGPEWVVEAVFVRRDRSIVAGAAISAANRPTPEQAFAWILGRPLPAGFEISRSIDPTMAVRTVKARKAVLRRLVEELMDRDLGAAICREIDARRRQVGLQAVTEFATAMPEGAKAAFDAIVGLAPPHGVTADPDWMMDVLAASSEVRAVDVFLRGLKAAPAAIVVFDPADPVDAALRRTIVAMLDAGESGDAIVRRLIVALTGTEPCGKTIEALRTATSRWTVETAAPLLDRLHRAAPEHDALDAEAAHALALTDDALRMAIDVDLDETPRTWAPTLATLMTVDGAVAPMPEAAMRVVVTILRDLAAIGLEGAETAYGFVALAAGLDATAIGALADGWSGAGEERAPQRLAAILMPGAGPEDGEAGVAAFAERTRTAARMKGRPDLRLV